MKRQAGRYIQTIIQRQSFPVKQEKEFVNNSIDDWYSARGIVHMKVSPKSSQLNPCERAHQSLVSMAKAMMEDSGLSRFCWADAIRNATYVKNRVYHKSHNGVPYEKMFGVRPDIHHIRKFGALANPHIPKTPGRKKFDDNAKPGFVLGYQDDTVGCKVYVPADGTKQFVSDLKVEESEVYRNRHERTSDFNDIKRLHFTSRSTGYDEDDSYSLDASYAEMDLFCSEDRVSMDEAVESQIVASLMDNTRMDMSVLLDIEDARRNADEEETMPRVAESIRTQINDTRAATRATAGTESIRANSESASVHTVPVSEHSLPEIKRALR
ncbi:TPA: hypothetical protein N0F65_002519 [Lagenidium giganteum]|uniref:Retroviral polymerase SH3-like domain-containing protein n=1 Tax=Lagenidium giganteum TaxID=4803 RepID=A0AAV2YX46_9STRA|nr:TPA: hypothetical protein N0F65_002519 [Lagenidium giganteum]